MRDRLLTLGVVVLIVLLGVYVKSQDANRAREARAIAQQARHLAREGKQAHDALCVFREGLQADIAKNARGLALARKFARDNPHGALGFTHAQLVALNKKAAADLRAQRKRRRALSIVKSCQEPRGHLHVRRSDRSRHHRPAALHLPR